MLLPLMIEERWHAVAETCWHVGEQIAIQVDKEGALCLNLDGLGIRELCCEIAASIGRSALVGNEPTLTDLGINRRQLLVLRDADLMTEGMLQSYRAYIIGPRKKQCKTSARQIFVSFAEHTAADHPRDLSKYSR